jgi:carboxylesterase
MSMKLPASFKQGFLLHGGGRSQILLLHGYTGSPYDLRVVGDFLAKHQCHVVAPLLQGHGSKSRLLNNVEYVDWLNQANAVIESFDKTRPIIIGGLSMGALLAISLAARYQIKALLLFSPALSLTLLAKLTIMSADFGLINKNAFLPKLSGGSDIMDPEAKQKTPAYKEMPVGGLLQFNKLRLMAKKSLIDVACPVFMAFGKHDASIDAYDSYRIAMAGLRQKQPVFSQFYDRSKHVVTLDYDREKLCHDLWQFLLTYVEM